MELLEIKIDIQEDKFADLSYLGKFGDEWKKYAIDRKQRGTWNRGEYRYFYPACAPMKFMTSKEKHAAWKDCERDFERMERYERGDWTLIEIGAVARIEIRGGIEEVTSGCVGGVESDSGEDYIRDIKLEQLEELKSILKEIGFTTEEIEEMKVEGIE